jgi:hypothetical protein
MIAADCVDSGLYARAFPPDDFDFHPVHLVINLTREFRAVPPPARAAHLPFCYWLESDPLSRLDQILSCIGDALAEGSRVLVHCRLGIDRTGIVILAHLFGIYGDVEESIAAYRAARAGVPLPRADAMTVFYAFVKDRHP